jgi:hypothetical protein
MKQDVFGHSCMCVVRKKLKSKADVMLYVYKIVLSHLAETGAYLFIMWNGVGSSVTLTWDSLDPRCNSARSARTRPKYTSFSLVPLLDRKVSSQAQCFTDLL